MSVCSGMETKIKSQREMILELEEKIKTNMDEIKKVHTAQTVVALYLYCIA